jgi:hypothetical protein
MTYNILNEHKTNAVYTVMQEGALFSLSSLRETNVCNFYGIQTEHPKLIIVPKTTYVFKKRPLTSSNLDMLTYVNSKFIFLERHIRTQMETLHKEIMTEKCNLNRELFEKEGYTALKAVEVVHIVQCQTVEVSFRGIKGECYGI